MIAKANLSQPFWPYFCEALALAIDEEQQPGRKRGKAVFRFLAKVAIKGFFEKKDFHCVVCHPDQTCGLRSYLLGQSLTCF